MPEHSVQPRLDRDPRELRDEWVARLKDLVANVGTWAGRTGWKTREITRTMKDSVLGEYRAPALLLQRDAVEVILNPVSRFIPGADGAVDLYRLPAFDDIASLYLMNDDWKVHYVFRETSGPARPREPEVLTLSEEAIVRVLDDISTCAA